MLSTPRFRIPLLLLVTVTVHTTVMPQLRIYGVMPDLLILVAVAAGMVGGPVRGAAMGFAVGLVADMFLTTPMGLSALVFSLVGYAVGMAAEGLLDAAAWFTPVIGGVASAGGVGLFAIVGATLGEGELIDGRLLAIMAVVGITNAILAPVMSRLVRWAMAGLVSRQTQLGPVAR